MWLLQPALVDELLASELFFGAHRAAVEIGATDPTNPLAEAADARRYASDLWAPAHADLDGFGETLRRGDAPGRPARVAGATCEWSDYATWMSTVSAPDHVEALRNAIPTAWRVAAQQYNGTATSPDSVWWPC